MLAPSFPSGGVAISWPMLTVSPSATIGCSWHADVLLEADGDTVGADLGLVPCDRPGVVGAHAEAGNKALRGYKAPLAEVVGRQVGPVVHFILPARGRKLALHLLIELHGRKLQRTRVRLTQSALAAHDCARQHAVLDVDAIGPCAHDLVRTEVMAEEMPRTQDRAVAALVTAGLPSFRPLVEGPGHEPDDLVVWWGGPGCPPWSW